MYGDGFGAVCICSSTPEQTLPDITQPTQTAKTSSCNNRSNGIVHLLTVKMLQTFVVMPRAASKHMFAAVWDCRWVGEPLRKDCSLQMMLINLSLYIDESYRSANQSNRSLRAMSIAVNRQAYRHWPIDGSGSMGKSFLIVL